MLALFTKVRQSYCTGGCAAGQGACRHVSERLWYQFHHWTNERHGIDRPPTLDACSWRPGSKVGSCEVRQEIHQHQMLKYERTLSKQKAKLDRGVKRNCTEGVSCDYQPYVSSKKQQYSGGRFTERRCKNFFELLRKQNT